MVVICYKLVFSPRFSFGLNIYIVRVSVLCFRLFSVTFAGTIDRCETLTFANITWQQCVGTNTCASEQPMRLRNGKMYSSTPTMEEEEQLFRLVTPVTVQVHHETPSPTVNRPRATPSASTRLPIPMPTFSLTSPTTQGPRAFFRNSGIFQPSAGTYVPFPELLSANSPPTQTSAQYVPPPTTPILMTPATVLYTSAAAGPQANNYSQQSDATFVAVSHQEPSTSDYVPFQQEMNTAFVADQQVPPFAPSEPFRTFIPSTNTVASLKRQLNKLEAENNRLRKENEHKYAELEKAAARAYQQTEERVAQLEKYIREGGQQGTQGLPGHSSVDDGRDSQFLSSMSRGGLSSSHRTFSNDERLTGNGNFKEWAEAVVIELQVTGILQVILSEFAGATNWPLPVKTRADAVARSLILHSVDSTIRPQVRGIPSESFVKQIQRNEYIRRSSNYV